MSVRTTVARWFDERPEYREEKPTSVADLILKEITIGDMEESLRATIVSAIGAIARSEGKNAVRDMHGRTVFVEVAAMPTLDGFLTEYLVPQVRRHGSDRRKAMAATRDFCARHPELGLSPERVWAMAEEMASGLDV